MQPSDADRLLCQLDLPPTLLLTWTALEQHHEDIAATCATSILSSPWSGSDDVLASAMRSYLRPDGRGSVPAGEGMLEHTLKGPAVGGPGASCETAARHAAPALPIANLPLFLAVLRMKFAVFKQCVISPLMVACFQGSSFDGNHSTRSYSCSVSISGFNGEGGDRGPLPFFSQWRCPSATDTPIIPLASMNNSNATSLASSTVIANSPQSNQQEFTASRCSAAIEQHPSLEGLPFRLPRYSPDDAGWCIAMVLAHSDIGADAATVLFSHFLSAVGEVLRGNEAPPPSTSATLNASRLSEMPSLRTLEGHRAASHASTSSPPAVAVDAAFLQRVLFDGILAKLRCIEAELRHLEELERPTSRLGHHEKSAALPRQPKELFELLATRTLSGMADAQSLSAEIAEDRGAMTHEASWHQSSAAFVRFVTPRPWNGTHSPPRGESKVIDGREEQYATQWLSTSLAHDSTSMWGSTVNDIVLVERHFALHAVNADLEKLIDLADDLRHCDPTAEQDQQTLGLEDSAAHMQPTGMSSSLRSGVELGLGAVVLPPARRLCVLRQHYLLIYAIDDGVEATSVPTSPVAVINLAWGNAQLLSDAWDRGKLDGKDTSWQGLPGKQSFPTRSSAGDVHATQAPSPGAKVREDPRTPPVTVSHAPDRSQFLGESNRDRSNVSHQVRTTSPPSSSGKSSTSWLMNATACTASQYPIRLLDVRSGVVHTIDVSRNPARYKLLERIRGIVAMTDPRTAVRLRACLVVPPLRRAPHPKPAPPASLSNHVGVRGLEADGEELRYTSPRGPGRLTPSAARGAAGAFASKPRNSHRSIAYHAFPPILHIDLYLRHRLPLECGLQDFYVICHLGSGTFGRVTLVQHKLTGEYFALKSIRKSGMRSIGSVIELRRECRLLTALNCPFIIKMHTAFQTDSCVFMLMDFLPGGELLHHVQCGFNRHLCEADTRVFIAEVAVGLNVLRQHNIVHRDIKLENIVLDADGHAVITDFGFARYVDGEACEQCVSSTVDRETDVRTARRASAASLPSAASANASPSGEAERVSLRAAVGVPRSCCGTLAYIAPEVLTPKRGYGFAVDWWSLGVLGFVASTGVFPFLCSTQSESTKAIQHNAVVFPKGSPLSANYRKLITSLLDKDPRKRLQSMKELAAHCVYADFDWAACSAKKASLRGSYFALCSRKRRPAHEAEKREAVRELKRSKERVLVEQEKLEASRALATAISAAVAEGAVGAAAPPRSTPVVGQGQGRGGTKGGPPCALCSLSKALLQDPSTAPSAEACMPSRVTCQVSMLHSLDMYRGFSTYAEAEAEQGFWAPMREPVRGIANRPPAIVPHPRQDGDSHCGTGGLSSSEHGEDAMRWIAKSQLRGMLAVRSVERSVWAPMSAIYGALSSSGSADVRGPGAQAVELRKLTDVVSDLQRRLETRSQHPGSPHRTLPPLSVGTSLSSFSAGNHRAKASSTQQRHPHLPPFATAHTGGGVVPVVFAEEVSEEVSSLLPRTIPLVAHGYDDGSPTPPDSVGISGRHASQVRGYSGAALATLEERHAKRLSDPHGHAVTEVVTPFVVQSDVFGCHLNRQEAFGSFRGDPVDDIVADTRLQESRRRLRREAGMAGRSDSRPGRRRNQREPLAGAPRSGSAWTRMEGSRVAGSPVGRQTDAGAGGETHLNQLSIATGSRGNPVSNIDGSSPLRTAAHPPNPHTTAQRRAMDGFLSVGRRIRRDKVDPYDVTVCSDGDTESNGGFDDDASISWGELNNSLDENLFASLSDSEELQSTHAMQHAMGSRLWMRPYKLLSAKSMSRVIET